MRIIYDRLKRLTELISHEVSEKYYRICRNIGFSNGTGVSHIVQVTSELVNKIALNWKIKLQVTSQKQCCDKNEKGELNKNKHLKKGEKRVVSITKAPFLVHFLN